MKKLLSLALAALLLLSLAACGEAPAPSSPGSSGDVSSSAEPTQTDTLSPVTTEEEVRALYEGDEDIAGITVEAYQGDFLVTLDNGADVTILDWVYGQSGIRRRMLWLDEPLLQCQIESQATVRVVTGGPNTYNGVPGFPHVELATLSLLYDEQGRDRGYDPYVSPGIGSSEIYWAGAGESYVMGMEGRREAIRSAQIDAGGLTVAFAPLADGSDFVAAYCEIPYTEVGLSEDGMTLTVTMHDTFLDCGKLGKDVDTTFLKDYGSLYPESFPAGEAGAPQVVGDDLIGPHAAPREVPQVADDGVFQVGEALTGGEAGADVGDLTVEAVEGHALQDLLLGGKVLIDRALADACRLGDILDLHGGGAGSLGDEPQGGLVDGGLPLEVPFTHFSVSFLSFRRRKPLRGASWAWGPRSPPRAANSAANSAASSGRSSRLSSPTSMFTGGLR